MNSFIKRRQFIAGSTVAMLLLTAPERAMAFSVENAKKLIGRVVADINSIINSGKTEAAMLRDFEQIFVNYADVKWVSQLVLGADGRSASAAQKAAFAKAFQGYISRKYGKRFREFIGGSVSVKKAKAIKSFYEVTTIAVLKGEAPFEVVFVVADKNGRFIDMKIEGISLVKAERTEIGAMLDKRRGDLDQMIADVKKAG